MSKNKNIGIEGETEMNGKIKVATAQGEGGIIIAEVRSGAHKQALAFLHAAGVKCDGVKCEFLRIPGKPRYFSYVPAPPRRTVSY